MTEWRVVGEPEGSAPGFVTESATGLDLWENGERFYCKIYGKDRIGDERHGTR